MGRASLTAICMHVLLTEGHTRLQSGLHRVGWAQPRTPASWGGGQLYRPVPPSRRQRSAPQKVRIPAP